MDAATQPIPPSPIIYDVKVGAGKAAPKTVFNQFFADMVAGASSIVMGGVTAWRLIEERAHKNLSSMYLTEDIKVDRVKHGTEIRRQVVEGTLTEQEAFHKLQEGVKYYENKMDERFLKSGVGSLGRKLGVLRSHQKWEVAVTSLAVTGVALGSVLLMTRELFAQSNGAPEKQKTSDLLKDQAHER